jgi:uncharacterized protein
MRMRIVSGGHCESTAEKGDGKMKKLAIQATVFGSIAVCCLVVALAFATTAEARTEFVSIGTGGTGGVYYPYGGGVAEIWNKHVEGVQAVAEVTGASVENVRLADKGETLFGLIMSDVAYQAYNGVGRFEGQPQKIKGMFVMYPNVFHLVVPRRSGIDNVEGIRGKKVSVGAPASGTEFMAQLVLEESLGIPYSSFNVFRLSFTETANALRDNTIDAGVWSVAPPTSSIMDLATTHDVSVVPFTREQIDKVTEKFPYYSDYMLPAESYRGQTGEILTPSVWNVFICNAEIDEDMVYRLTKAVFDNQKTLVGIHPFAANTTLENTVRHSAIPLHPGAIRYLREKGLEVPEHLIGQ